MRLFRVRVSEKSYSRGIVRKDLHLGVDQQEPFAHVLRYRHEFLLSSLHRLELHIDAPVLLSDLCHERRQLRIRLFRIRVFRIQRIDGSCYPGCDLFRYDVCEYYHCYEYQYERSEHTSEHHAHHALLLCDPHDVTVIQQLCIIYRPGRKRVRISYRKGLAVFLSLGDLLSASVVIHICSILV